MVLVAVGCGLAPLTTWSTRGFEFSSSEVETLAEMEHRRWCEEKIRQGWSKGARSDKERSHPDLRPFEELDEETKELDRDVVRQLPSRDADLR